VNVPGARALEIVDVEAEIVGTFKPEVTPTFRHYWK